MKPFALGLLVAAVLGLGALMVAMPEPVDPYCEMVSIYQQSGGEYGWPDYRGNYDEVCKYETAGRNQGD